jgi:hypothetical protein
MKEILVRCFRCNKRDILIRASVWWRIKYKLFNKLPKLICGRCQIGEMNRCIQQDIEEITGVPDFYLEEPEGK